MSRHPDTDLLGQFHAPFCQQGLSTCCSLCQGAPTVHSMKPASDTFILTCSTPIMLDLFSWDPPDLFFAFLHPALCQEFLTYMDYTNGIPCYWNPSRMSQEKRQQRVRGSEVRWFVLLASSLLGLYGLVVSLLPKATALAGVPSLTAMTTLPGFQELALTLP